MRNKKLSLILVTAMTLAASSCGRGPSGNYNVTQTLTGGQLASNCLSSQMTLTLDMNGSSVSGRGTNACFSESLTGTSSGTQITGVVLTITPIANNTTATTTNNPYYNPSYPPNYGSTYGQTQSTPCSYTGTLDATNDRLSGTLFLQNSGQSGGYYSYGSCPSQITINGAMN